MLSCIDVSLGDDVHKSQLSFELEFVKLVFTVLQSCFLLHSWQKRPWHVCAEGSCELSAIGARHLEPHLSDKILPTCDDFY